MIFIYNCYAGTHTSSLASAVHLNKLPVDRVPDKDEILGTDYFDRLTVSDIGRIIFRGNDEEGNRVFSLGRGSSRVVVPSLAHLIDLLVRDFGFNEKIVFSNMSPTVPPIMSVGGFMSRRLGLVHIGRPLLVAGTKQAYQQIVDIVNHTKEKAKASNEHVLVLDNRQSVAKSKTSENR